MMFALGFLTGIVGTFAMFVFATWRHKEIHEIIQKVEDVVSEPGGFVDNVDITRKTEHDLKEMLREK